MIELTGKGGLCSNNDHSSSSSNNHSNNNSNNNNDNYDNLKNSNLWSFPKLA